MAGSNPPKAHKVIITRPYVSSFETDIRQTFKKEIDRLKKSDPNFVHKVPPGKTPKKASRRK